MHAAQVCFQISTVVRSILEKVISNDPMNDLQLRLISKTFNSEFLHKIRKSHRKILLWYVETGCVPGSYWREYTAFEVNGHRVHTSRARKYFKFLTKVAGVRIEELRTERMTLSIDSRDRKQFYKDIQETLIKGQKLKVLTGMEDLCRSGCKECELFAPECKEYGPLELNVLKHAFQKPHHFEKLLISETLLRRIAKRCVKKSTKEKCMDHMKSLITPNITCDHLVLYVSQAASYPKRKHHIALRTHYPTEPLPREIIEEMCRVWKPKSIGIVVIRTISLFNSSPKWPKKEYFTEMYLDQSLEKTQKSMDVEFEFLEIDIRKAEKACIELIDKYEEGLPNFNNLIANAQRLFPTKRVMVQNHWDPQHYGKVKLNMLSFRNVLKTVWKDETVRDSELTITFFPSIWWRDYGLLESFYFMNRNVTVLELPTRKKWTTSTTFRCPKRWTKIHKYTIRTFQVTDEKMNRVINLEVFEDVFTQLGVPMYTYTVLNRLMDEEKYRKKK